MTAAASPVTVREARARINELAHLNAFISISDEQGDGPAVAVKDLIDVAGTVQNPGGGRLLPTFRPRVTRRSFSVFETAGAWSSARRTSTSGLMARRTSIPTSVLHAIRWTPIASPEAPPGGSAVAVATCMCDSGIGTDTAGSLRIPASLPGVVSIKPTYGKLPTDGVIELSLVARHARPAGAGCRLRRGGAGADVARPAAVAGRPSGAGRPSHRMCHRTVGRGVGRRYGIRPGRQSRPGCRRWQSPIGSRPATSAPRFRCTRPAGFIGTGSRRMPIVTERTFVSDCVKAC